jgi:hypothetical protein
MKSLDPHNQLAQAADLPARVVEAELLRHLIAALDTTSHRYASTSIPAITATRVNT